MQSVVTPPPMPEVTHLVITPTISVKRALCSAFRKVEGSSSEQNIADFTSVTHFNSCSILGPAVGAPAAMLAAEGFLRSGCKRIFLIGGCGSLLEELRPGCLFVPQAAYVDCQVAYDYGAEKNLLAKTRFTISPELGSVVYGKIWTTDSPYRETKERIELAIANGAVAVDMEYAALLQLSYCYQVGLIAILVVTDSVGESWARRFGHGSVKKRFLQLAELLARGLLVD